MAWPFKRKQTEQFPLEVQDYYQAEKRERVGVAWLLAAVTLVVTVIAATGIFFGGRWLYRNLANSDQKPTTTVQQPQTDNPPAQTTPSISSPAPSTATPPTSTTPTPVPSTPSTTSPPRNTKPSTTNSNPTVTRVPDTGPGDLLAIFVAASILGAVLHRSYLIRSRH